MTSTSILKKFALIFDVICALLALVLIAFGIYVLNSYKTNGFGTMGAYAYIGIGVSTLLVPRWIAALRENVCCTVTFIILLYVVLLAQVSVMFFLTKETNAVASNLANDLDTTWEEELRNPGAMSIYENWFECCGRVSPQDYIVNERLPPVTCFKNHDNSLSSNLIEGGCRIQFESYWINLLNVFNVIAWILIALEFIGSILSCCLCNSIRNDHRRTYF